jgi:hypothetical protein
MYDAYTKIVKDRIFKTKKNTIAAIISSKNATELFLKTEFRIIPNYSHQSPLFS